MRSMQLEEVPKYEYNYTLDIINLNKNANTLINYITLFVIIV